MTIWYEEITSKINSKNPKAEKHEPAAKPSVSLLKSLYEMELKKEEWISKLPSDISDAFFDNPYVNGMQRQLDEMINAHFGIHSDSVDWLLYEWREGLEVSIDGKRFKINAPEDYYKYLIENEGWVE